MTSPGAIAAGTRGTIQPPGETKKNGVTLSANSAMSAARAPYNARVKT